MISAGGNRDFEFIYEANGNPRNEGADKLGGIPADRAAHVLRADRLRRPEPDRLLLLRRRRTFLPVGRPAPLATFTNPQIGPAALSDAAPDRADGALRLDPLRPGRHGRRRHRRRRRRLRGHDARLGVGDASAATRARSSPAARYQIPAQPGDIYQTRNDAKNLIVRDAPDGAWVATTKVNFEGTAQYHQAGIMVYGDDDELHEVRPHRPQRQHGRRREVRVHQRDQRASPATRRPTRRPTSPADFPDDF